MLNKINKYYYIPLILTFFIFIFKIVLNWSFFNKKFDYEYLARLYNNSQFAESIEDRKEIIQDEDLYVFAGTEYLIKGSLDKVNVEHPPLGKYIFGFAYLINQRPVLVQILFGILFLFLSFKLSLKLLKNKCLASLVPLFLVCEEMFFNMINRTLLDLMQATMILLLFNLILKKKTNTKDWIFEGIVLGSVASIKFPVTAFLILASLFITDLVKEKVDSSADGKKYLVISLVCCLFYLFMYLPLIINSGFGSFLSTQIKAVRIHRSHVPEYREIAALRVMVLNQWPVWWDNQNPIHTSGERNFLWPVLALGILISPILWKKINKTFLIFAWIYFIFINARLFFPHYLFILMPFLYIILVKEIEYILELKKK